METHHEAWLQAHTDRTAEWLEARLAEGFDVHHLDGDHSNNDPHNLILIEHADHMRLHGMGTFIAKRLTARGGGRPVGATGPNGRFCYETRHRTGAPWKHIGDLCGIKGNSAAEIAKKHAARHSLPWPPEAKETKAEDPAYAGILRKFHHLPPAEAKRAQWFYDTTVR